METMTLRKVSPARSRETYEEQHAAHRYNAATVATFKRKRFVLSAGRSDSLTFWAESNRLYCLALNSSLGYAGLEAFDTSPLEREETHEESADSASGERRRELTPAREACGSVFMQNAFEEIERTNMESDPFDMSKKQLFDILSQYLP
jgi:hypothetical protein